MKILIISVLFVSGLFFGVQESETITIALQTDSKGKEIFKNNCASCHTGGFKAWLTGAPEIGKFDEWEEYLKKDINELTNNVYTGDEDHKKKGGCKKCSEEDIKTAIEYVISKTK